MNTVRKFFNLSISALKTVLRSESRVNSYQLSSSIFSFIRQILSKLSPRYIANVSVNTPEITFLHFINIQIFNTNYAKTINEFLCFLMTKVISSIRNSFVNASDNFFCFLSFNNVFLKFREFSCLKHYNFRRTSKTLKTQTKRL